MTAIRNQIMKGQMTKLAGVIFTCAFIAACSSDNSSVSLNSGSASSGDADFTKFVSIGDSLTAGYADGALYLLGQTNSYPNILAQQFAGVGGGAFTQPLVSDDSGGLIYDGNNLIDLNGDRDFDNRLVLNTDPNPSVEDESPSPERLVAASATEVNGSGLNGMTFNNMGVPGAKSFHLLAAGYGNAAGVDPADTSLSLANPYFARFSTSGTATVLGDASVQAPSFYVLWVGNNDVLSYATSGGFDSVNDVNAVDQTGLGNPVNAYGPSDITDPTAFAGVYAALVGAMTAANPAVQGVLINIPDVSTIPFFTTVPFNAVPLDDQADVDALNGAYAAYNTGLGLAVAGAVITAEEAAQRKIVFALGQNAMVILDETLTPIGGPETFLRQTTENDLVVLLASTAIQTLGGGTSVPLADADVLIPSEIQAINTARTAFNATIKAAADADANLVFVDAAAIMTELKASGIAFGTGSINSDFATGGAFSLDGVHPTGRGYAVIANEIIDAINTGFNANVHKVDPAGLPTIFLK